MPWLEPAAAAATTACPCCPPLKHTPVDMCKPFSPLWQVLGGPCRVETEWPAVNSGLAYTDHVQHADGRSLLQWYAWKHAASASADSWRHDIQAGRITVNGEVVRDPDAPIP